MNCKATGWTLPIALALVVPAFSADPSFDLSKLREVAGFGLRVRAPYFLLRLDYGFKLDRLETESRGEFFFSIGQSF